MGHEFAFGLLIFRSYDVFMMFGYKMNKFSKKQLIHQIFEEELHRFALLFFIMSRIQLYSDVKKIYGNSYSTVGLNIDGPDKIINNKVKELQAREFAEVAEARLFIQKQHFRYKLIDERNKQNNTDSKKTALIEDVHPNISIEEEFKDFETCDFMPLNYNEEELVDIIIDIKMDEIEEDVVQKERCCAWILTHCK